MSTESDEARILHLVAAATLSLAHCRTEAVYLDGNRRASTPGIATAPHVRQLDSAVSALDATGGAIAVAGAKWGWAYPLAGRGLPYGFFVVGCADEPEEHEKFVLGVLVQQAGAAIAGARTHEQSRVAAAQLQALNDELESSLEQLRSVVATHDRLITAAAAGADLGGIAVTLNEVTGLTVAIEDQRGRLRAWAGNDRPEPYPLGPADRRERLIARLQAEVHPVRDAGRLLALSQPRPDLLAVIVLFDPQGRAGEPEQMALEHAASLVGTELVRVASVTNAELRLGRDLVDDLLAGATEASVRNRLDALGYSAGQLQVVVLVDGHGPGHAQISEAYFNTVRRVAEENGMGGLFARRGRMVLGVCVSDADWERFRSGVTAQARGAPCRVAVGGTCRDVSELPRSLREAQLAMKLQRVAAPEAQVTTFDDLGVYRLLGSGGDTDAVDSLVQRWLGALLRYDEQRRAQLTLTLSVYLEAGGHHDTAARELCVHRSTLKYRLQRIRDVSGLDLGDPETQFNLQVATRAWRTLRAMREPGP